VEGRRSSEPLMAMRRNLKKEKRLRNRQNAFRFKQPTPRFRFNRRNDPDPKLAGEDAEFYSKIFTYTAEADAMAAEAAAKAPEKAMQTPARSSKPMMKLTEELLTKGAELQAALEMGELEGADLDTATLLLALRRGNRMRMARRGGAPAMSAVDDVIDTLKSMTLLEAKELVKQIEETFDVDASAGSGMMMAAPMPGGAVGAAGGDGADGATEKTEFDLVLESFPADKKIAVLKVVRELTGLGLKDAKAKVEAAPCAVKEGASKVECEEALKKLEEAGATAALK